MKKKKTAPKKAAKKVVVKKARGSRQVRISSMVSALIKQKRKGKEFVDATLRRLLKLPAAA